MQTSYVYALDFEEVIIRLIGTKEESKIATTIAKMTKHDSREQKQCPLRCHKICVRDYSKIQYCTVPLLRSLQS